MSQAEKVNSINPVNHFPGDSELFVLVEKLRKFLDCLPDFLLFKDGEGRFVWVNAPFADALKLGSTQEAVGKKVGDFPNLQLGERLLDAESKALQKAETSVGIEDHEIWPDGKERWLYFTLVPLKSENGKVLGTFSMARDISDIKRFEDYLMVLMNNIPDKIYFKDLKSRFMLVNSACAQQFGLRSPQEALGKRDFDFFQEEHAEDAYKDEQRIIKTGKPVLNKEELEIWPGGRESWVHSIKMPLRNYRGDIVGTFGVSRDITSQKRVEELLHTLMDNIPDSIYFKDRESRFKLINMAKAQRYNLKDPSEAVGKTDFDFFPEEEAKESLKDEKKIMETGIPIISKEEIKTRSDGSQKWISTTKLPWRNKYGKIIGTFGVSRDITAMRQAEQQLQILMTSIPDHIYFKDRESRFTLINKNFTKDLGIQDSSEALGKTDFDFFPRDHAQESFNDERHIMESGKPIIGKEESVLFKDGRTKWISTTKLPLINTKGEILGTFGLSRDITKLKSAEEALQKSNEVLEKTVAKRTAELQKANENMEVRIQQLGYLNKQARVFTQIIEMEALLKKIYRAFSQRFFQSQVHLCILNKDAFESCHYTDRFEKEPVRNVCLEALDYLKSNKEEKVFFEIRWMENPMFKDLFDVSLVDLPCYIEIPLVANKVLRGAVQVFAPAQFAEDYERESIVLNTLASQAAISLDNAIHYKELGVQARLESELEIAQKIQKHYTPVEPDIPRFQLKGICQPANEVGGDYLDYFQNKTGDWVLVIADVCGKGIPAALVMTSLRSTLRAEAQNLSSAKDILSAVNRFMSPDLQLDHSFITCICIVLKQGGNSLNYCRAGHPMLIYHPSGGEPKPVKSQGIALGMLSQSHFEELIEEVELELMPGDRILAYTDGLDETMNSAKATYGIARLYSLLKDKDSLKPAHLVEAILSDVKNFAKGQDQNDDLTLFAMEKL